MVHHEKSPWQGAESSFWARWARLSSQSIRTESETWQVQPVVRPCYVVFLTEF